MEKRLNILFGGSAGTGPNILTHVLGRALVKQGYYVFYSRDYQSLIRGGHNFNVLTFSDKPLHSNDSKIDVLVALDENTIKLHYKNLKKNSVVLKNHKQNMYYAGRVFKLLGINFKFLDNELKILKEKYKENIIEAKKGYEEETKKIWEINFNKTKNYFVNGNQGVSEGAIKSGLDVYFAYPMTPATSVLIELAQKQFVKNYIVLKLENELAIINAGIGSAITGAKTMIGTSGGGFDLMTEALSLTGIAGVPLVIFLSQRPGPGTGVATYTAQGDLNIALHSGHGEFNRIVLAPGDPKEAEELTSQAFYFSQKFKIPVIIISDKHLGESFYTLKEKAKITYSKKSTCLKRYNSYEADKEGSATEDEELIKKNIQARLNVNKELKKEAKKFKQYEIYGKKNSKNVVISWGSTKGVIFDAIKDLDCKFIQIKYLEPFPLQIEKELKNKNLILIENNATGLLGNLIREKTGIEIKKKILKYDGRPFLCDKLKEKIKNKLKEKIK